MGPYNIRRSSVGHSPDTVNGGSVTVVLRRLRLCYGGYGYVEANYGHATVVIRLATVSCGRNLIFEHSKIWAAEKSRLRKCFGSAAIHYGLSRSCYGCTTDVLRIAAEANRSASVAQTVKV